jgi:hypothetical protein
MIGQHFGPVGDQHYVEYVPDIHRSGHWTKTTVVLPTQAMASAAA